MGPVRILIVDDFERWRSAIRAILAEDTDLEVIGEGVDGLEAVRMCEELKPDLVLLDLMLPKMSGLEAARLIKECCPATKIVLMSSSHFSEMMRESVRVGASFIVKSDAGRDLLPVIKAAIRDEPFVRFRVLDDGPADPEEA